MSSLEGNLVEVPALRIVQVHGAGQARVKGMDGAEDFNWLVELGDGRADERLFKGGSLLVASRGEPFQVVGTTSW